MLLNMDMELVDIKSPKDFPALNVGRYGFGILPPIRDFKIRYKVKG
jgi:hypothetical protein